MALLDHFVQDAGSVEDGGNGFERIAIHHFAAALSYGKKGTYGTTTEARDRIIREFNLQADDLPQLDAVLADLNSLRDNDRAGIGLFLQDLERSLIGLEGGVATVAEATTNLIKRPDVVVSPSEL